MLRDPKTDHAISSIFRAGADYNVQLRLGEFVASFRKQGARLTNIQDSMCALSVGAALSAPFISITDLISGTLRKLVFDAVAADRSTAAVAALLSVSAATDGEVEALAGTAAASIDSGVQEPPWARAAREPVNAFKVDVLSDRDGRDRTALLVTVKQAGYRAAFFMRFYQGSLITEQIHFLPEVKRSILLAQLAAGTEFAYPYRYFRRTEVTDNLIGLVNAIMKTNEQNLFMGQGFPPYPPNLDHLASIGDVTVVPALLMLLRKFLGSVSGLAEWKFGDDYPSIWR